MKINPKPTIRVADMSLRIPIVQSFVSQSARSKYDAAIGAVSAKSKGCLHRTPGGLFRAVEIVNVPAQIQNTADGQINYSSHLDH